MSFMTASSFLFHGPVRMRGMRAEDPRRLEVESVFRRDVAVLVLVLQAEAQELAPVPRDVRRGAPHLLRVVDGVFRPVEAQACVPIAVELLLQEEVRAECVL